LDERVKGTASNEKAGPKGLRTVGQAPPPGGADIASGPERRQSAPEPQPGRPRAWVLWLYAVGAAVVWQPLMLGFYMDDWGACVAAARQGAAFSSARFQYILGIDPTRPIVAVIRFVLSSLLGDWPVLWQAALLCTGAALAFTLGKAVLVLISTNSRAARIPVWSVSACWLILPWAVGFRLWPVLLPVHLLLIGFWLMIYRLVLSWKTGKTMS